MDLSRASRAATALWVMTVLTYAVNPQLGIPWINLAPSLSKGQWAAVNLVFSLLLFRFPLSRPLLVLTGLLSLVSQLAWHSWLGALPPWVPFLFFWLALFADAPAEQRRRAVLDSIVLAIGMAAIHRLNPEFLGGFEFRQEGMFAKLFPETVSGWLEANSAVAAKAWWVFSVAPLALLFAGRRAWALGTFAAYALATCFLYPVLFYGFFLSVPLCLAAGPAVLSRWRGGRERIPRLGGLGGLKPLHVTFVGMALFFAWYLWARLSDPFWSYSTYWAMVAFSVASVLLAEPWAWSGFGPVAFRPVSPRRMAWIGLFLAYLAAPIFFTEIPAPFGATHFSARDARYPASVWIPSPSVPADCKTLKNEYALRWGYRLRPTPSGCQLSVYR